MLNYLVPHFSLFKDPLHTTTYTYYDGSDKTSYQFINGKTELCRHESCLWSFRDVFNFQM